MNFEFISQPEPDPYGTNSSVSKSESEYSIAWDAALEQAKQEALAPDRVELVSSFLIGHSLSVVSHDWLSTL